MRKNYINSFKYPTFVKQFLRENSSITPTNTQRNNAVYNSPNRDILEQKKRQLSLSNSDIVDIMNSFAAGVFEDKDAKIISLPSFQRKMSGQSNFNSIEIRILVEILDLTPIETLLAFNLFSAIDLHMFTDDEGSVHPEPMREIMPLNKKE